MRHHRSLRLALAIVLLLGSWPASADETLKPTLLNAERPFVFQIEAVYAYVETEAKLSSEIGFLVPTLGQGQFTTKTLEMSNVGGQLRALGPLLWGVLRPFIEGGAQTAGFENSEGDLITSQNYGIPGKFPQTSASLQYDWLATTSLGVAVPVPIGKSLLTLMPSVGWSWDAYVAQINYYEYGMPLATILPNEGIVKFPGTMATLSRVTAHYDVGSFIFGGEATYQPLPSIPVYMFVGANWRKPLTNYHRNQCNISIATQVDSACGHYIMNGGAVFRTGIGVQF